MPSFTSLGLLLTAFVSTALAADLATLEAQLKPQLSQRSSITFQKDPPLRWSQYKAPNPLFVVNVASEKDVVHTISAATKLGVKFLVQNGGVGWQSEFDLHDDGIIINMAALNSFSLSADKKQATIGGGAKINETIAAAYDHGVQVVTGNCNCVGTLGALLGGGYGNLVGLHGMGVDQVLSLRIVTADGHAQTVTAQSDPELFWGLRGAGPNLGVVVSATVKAYPTDSAGMLAWTANVGFTEDKLEQVVAAIDALALTPHTNIFLYLIGAPDGSGPIVLTTPFYYNGNETAGRDFFKSIYDIGPVVDASQVIPYNEWNSGADFFCAKDGARKPSYGAGFNHLVPSTWRKVWDLYYAFQALPGASQTAVVLERYDLAASQRAAGSSPAAFDPHRFVGYQGFPIAWYQDEALDADARVFGEGVREAFRETSGLGGNSTYVNFAHGDEDNEVVYGASLPRLQALKRRVDPQNHFGQWFPIRI